MDSGFYAACTGLIARTQALDVVANNLANTSTTGYRAERGLFQSLLASASGLPLSPINQAVNDFGVLGGTRLDLTQGSLERTGNELDIGIDGPGFLAVQTGKGKLYTRAGNLQLSSKGQLTTSAGDPVLGDQGPIQITGGPVSISTDGTISAGDAVVGKLKLIDFAAGTKLESAGGTYYSAGKATELEAKNSKVQQGQLESSNVNPVASAVDLITVQRNAEMMQRALTMFDSDMNKTAAQELSRVNQ